MAVREFIGMRAVPIVGRIGEESVIWDGGEYEHLVVVQSEGGDTYMSRCAVPAGTPLSDTHYWAKFGSFNAQFAVLQRTVETYNARITQAQGDAEQAQSDIAAADIIIADLREILEGFSDEGSVKAAIDAVEENASARDEVIDAKIGTLPAGYDSVIEYSNERFTALGTTVEDLSDTLDGFTPETPVKSYIDSITNELLTAKQPIDIQTGYIDTLSGSNVFSYYILAKIPRIYKVSQAIRNGSVSDYSGRTYDYVKRSTDALLANGALYGPIVSKGQVKMNSVTTEHTSSYSHILCFNANNEPAVIADVDQLAQASTLLSQGYVETIPCFCPILTNGVPQAFVGNEELLEKHTREIFAWDSDYWYVLIIEGRNPRSTGATYAEMQLICSYFGLNDAVQMDGGGSTELWIPSTLQNLVFANSERVAAGYSSRYINLLTFNQE